MSAKEKPPYWIDCLQEKHECFPYGDAKSIRVKHDGRSLRILVPKWMSAVTPLAITQADNLLMMLGRLAKEWDNRPLGVMLIAKKRGDDKYEVGVWHELYPWALKHLGFVPAES
jgi:hypothetical protein